MEEKRVVTLDKTLNIEAYYFSGLAQPFPNHFHEYYVIGLMESGERCLRCNGNEYTIKAGDMVVFNPLDNHSCCQTGQLLMGWRCFNISKESMLAITKDIAEADVLPVFSPTVICGSELAERFSSLHKLVISGQESLEKEERFYFLLQELLSGYSKQGEQVAAVPGIEKVRGYIAENYSNPISLAQLCAVSGFEKYTLLRQFVRKCGITPYQYLETVRVNEAKKHLENGENLSDIAYKTGFTDQSHFTRFFKNFTGLTPKQYKDIFEK